MDSLRPVLAVVAILIGVVLLLVVLFFSGKLAKSMRGARRNAIVIYGLLFVIVGFVMWMRSSHRSVADRPSQASTIQEPEADTLRRPLTDEESGAKSPVPARLSTQEAPFSEESELQPSQGGLDMQINRSYVQPTDPRSLMVAANGGSSFHWKRNATTKPEIEDRIFAFLNDLLDRIELLFYPEFRQRPSFENQESEVVHEVSEATPVMKSRLDVHGKEKPGFSNSMTPPKPVFKTDPVVSALETAKLTVGTFRAKAMAFFWGSHTEKSPHSRPIYPRVATPLPTAARSDSVFRR